MKHSSPPSHLLYRIRALGSWLSKENDNLTVTPESVEALRQQLLTIEHDFHGIVDYIIVCYQSLDDMDTKPGTCTGEILSLIIITLKL